MKQYLEKYLPPNIVKALPIIIAVALVAVAVIILILDAPRRRALGEVSAASGRIQSGLNSIPITTRGNTETLHTFLETSEGNHPRIGVDVDFRQVLSGVHITDFTTAWQEREAFINALYDNIAKLFSQTNDLSVRVSNPSYVNQFDTLRDYTRDFREFGITIYRLLSDSEGNFRDNVQFEVITDHGVLYLNSVFFVAERDAHRITFGLEESNEYNPVIYLSVFDQAGNEMEVRNPGDNFRLIIPLSSDLMRDLGGELLYDSVEFIGEGGLRQGDVLDYFIENNNLYVYTNRSGRFRFVSINEDATLERIQDAIDRIEVWADGTNSRLGDFRGVSDRTFSEILVTIDFESILQDVRLFDFLVASGHVELFNEELYNILALLFERTDSLIIRERNADYIGNFALLADEFNTNEFQIEVSRFLRSPDKFLRIDTHFGNLDVYSNFFYDSTGHTAETTGSLSLLFSFEEGAYELTENEQSEYDYEYNEIITVVTH